MIDYEAVVREMVAHLEQEVKDHTRGEMMSLAESIHGELHSRYHLNFLKNLIDKHTGEDVKS